MNIADIILLLILLVGGVVTGLKNGLIRQLASIVALVLGGLLSYKFSSSLAQYMAGHLQLSSNLLNLIAFTVIFLVVFYGLYLFGVMLSKIVKLTIGGWVDKLLGVAFALAKVALILGIFILVFDSLNSAFGFVNQDRMNQSQVYIAIKKFTDVAFPYLREMIASIK